MSAGLGTFNKTVPMQEESPNRNVSLNKTVDNAASLKKGMQGAGHNWDSSVERLYDDVPRAQAVFHIS